MILSAWTNSSQLRRAVQDLTDGLRRWPQWMTLGNREIVQKYRRSVLGPLWITLSMGIMVAALGTLYSYVLNQERASYLPYLAAGLVIWGFVSSALGEGCNTFISNEGSIKQVYTPHSVYVYKVLWRNLMIFFHNFLVFVVAIAIFGPMPDWITLLAIPGLFLLVINVAWITLMLGVLCTRFRDVSQLVGSVLQLSVMFTPIIWRLEPNSPLQVFVDWNPFYHGVEIVRAPLLGELPPLDSWIGAVVIAVLGWGATLALFARFRWRIAYWL